MDKPSPKEIKLRLNRFDYEESKIALYDYVLKNDNLEKTVSVIEEIIRQELIQIKKDYNEIVDAHRNKSFAFTRLGKEMERLNVRLSKTEEKLDVALRSLGSLEEDEQRAHEQLEEIKVILEKAPGLIQILL